MKTTVPEIIELSKQIVDASLVTFLERKGCLVMSNMKDGISVVETVINPLPDLDRAGVIEWLTLFNERIHVK